MNHPERKTQIAFFQWCNLMCRKYPCLTFMHGSMVGTFTSIGVATRNKAMGSKSGFPDTFLPYPTFIHSGLFIEFKAKGGVLSVNQKIYIKYLNEVGYLAVPCWTLDEAITLTEDYINGRR